MTMNLLTGANSIQTGASIPYVRPNSLAQHNLHVQATVNGTGPVTATVLIEASLDPTTMGWAPVYSVDLGGTTQASSISTILGGAGYYRASVTAISGIGAAVSVRVD